MAYPCKIIVINVLHALSLSGSRRLTHDHRSPPTMQDLHITCKAYRMSCRPRASSSLWTGMRPRPPAGRPARNSRTSSAAACRPAEARLRLLSVCQPRAAATAWDPPAWEMPPPWNLGLVVCSNRAFLAAGLRGLEIHRVLLDACGQVPWLSRCIWLDLPRSSLQASLHASWLSLQLPAH